MVAGALRFDPGHLDSFAAVIFFIDVGYPGMCLMADLAFSQSVSSGFGLQFANCRTIDMAGVQTVFERARACSPL